MEYKKNGRVEATTQALDAQDKLPGFGLAKAASADERKEPEPAGVSQVEVSAIGPSRNVVSVGRQRLAKQATGHGGYRGRTVLRPEKTEIYFNPRRNEARPAKDTGSVAKMACGKSWMTL